MKEDFFKEGRPLMLAPMAELTTPPFRKVVRKFSGRAVLFSEMLSSPAVEKYALYNEPLMHINEEDPPFVYQLLGGDPESMASACRVLSSTGCTGININMGCSSPTILKQCRGSRLLKEFELSRELVGRCRESYKGNLSVKLRSGFENHDPEYILEFAQMLEDEGIDFIIMHGRFAKLAFKRKADWKMVKLLKDNCKVPVVGNGDIESVNEISERIDDTGCDGIMIGREAVKSPWLFRTGEAVLAGEDYSFQVDLLETAREVLFGIEEMLPPELHKSRAHRFSAYYSKNFKFSHELFRNIRNVDKIEEMVHILENYLENNPDERFKKFTGS